MGTKKQRANNCLICSEGINSFTFRDSDFLRTFISGQHKILPRRKTGTCAKHQRQLSREIKRAREMATLPYRGQYGK